MRSARHVLCERARKGHGSRADARPCRPPRSFALRAELQVLERAKARLDRLALYPRPVSIGRVRIIVSGKLFRLPWLRRFDGYAAWGMILLRDEPRAEHDDLVCHELCHVWQMQHHPLRMPLSYLTQGYANNVFEAEARRAVEGTAT